jgi:hypothetical protein
MSDKEFDKVDDDEVFVDDDVNIDDADINEDISIWIDKEEKEETQDDRVVNGKPVSNAKGGDDVIDANIDTLGGAKSEDWLDVEPLQCNEASMNKQKEKLISQLSSRKPSAEKEAIFIVGPPGAGKSTYSKKAYKDYVYINVEDIFFDMPEVRALVDRKIVPSFFPINCAKSARLISYQLSRECIDRGLSYVYDFTEPQGGLILDARKNNYKVTLVIVNHDNYKDRVLKRFPETGILIRNIDSIIDNISVRIPAYGGMLHNVMYVYNDKLEDEYKPTFDNLIMLASKFKK